MSLGLFLAFVLACQGELVTNLVPVADSSLLESNPDNNLGGLAAIPAGTTQQGRSRAVFRFDLTVIPPEAFIARAELEVVAVTENALHQSSIFALHRLLRGWGEGVGAGSNSGDPATTNAATWNNRFHPTSPWSVPGGAPGSDYAAGFSATNFVDALTNYTFGSSPGMVGDVQAWVKNPGSNFGWILLSQSESTTFTVRRFGSREDSLHTPSLKVWYLVPPVISAPAISGGQIRFSFPADSNRSYTIEMETSLANGAWMVLTNIPALTAAGTVQVRDSISNKAAFYRVRSP